MVGQAGIASASAASAVAERYREAASIQAQRVSAKTQAFASVLPPEPSVISTVGKNAVTSSTPARLPPGGAVPERPVIRSVLVSPALAKRGAAAYGAAVAILRSEADAEAPLPSNSSVTVDC